MIIKISRPTDGYRYLEQNFCFASQWVFFSIINGNKPSDIREANSGVY